MIVNQVNEFQVNVKADLLTLRLASLNQIVDPWVYILFRHSMVCRLKTAVFRLLTKCFPKFEEQFKHKEQSLNKNSYELNSEHIAFTSENLDTIGSLSDADDISPPQRRRASKKYNKRSRSSMVAAQLKLVNGHTQDCPGLKHANCLYCFTSLPQQFALMLGTSEVEADEQKTQDQLETVEESNTRSDNI